MTDAGTSTVTSAPNLVPGYKLIEQLGRGATTVVYRARRRAASGPDVAIKMLREPSDDASQLAATYRREAALLARVTHPSVTTVHAAGEADGRPYVVLELVEGTSLAGLIGEGPLAETQVLQIAIDAASALSAVHRMQVVHRDVKPGNLILTPSGRTKLIDFDLASWAGEPAPEGSVAGTLAYSAPEQTGMFARPIDGRADLYALGVVLFECITGRRPFDADDVGELLHLHAVAPPPQVRHLRPDCSPGLAAVVAKLLAKDPDDRYQTAVGLIADLEHLRDSPRDWPFPLDTATIALHDVDLPLVGRDAELAHLVGRWERTTKGEGGLALVDGAVGSGTHRLTRELIDTVVAQDGCVLQGRCSDDQLPLGVLRTAVERHIHAMRRLAHPQREAAERRLRRAADGVEPLLANLSPALSALLDRKDQAPPSDDLQEHVAAAVAGFIGELAMAEDGLLLVLQDVHRIDSASQRALQYLCAEAGAAPLLILLTTPHDATEQVEAGLLMPADTRLYLGPLGPPAVAALVANELGDAHVSTEIADQIAARTGGNPFGILEYLRRLIDAGGLQPSWGRWTLDTALLNRLNLPSNVTDLMVDRLDGLAPADRRLLAAAAVQGIRFDTTLLAATASARARASGSEPAGGDLTPDAVADAVAGATRERVIEHVSGNVHTFVHDDIRDVLLADLDAGGRAGLHQRVAEVLEAGGAVDTAQLYAVARHRVAAGTDPRRTYEACMAAGRAALARQAPADATAFLRDASAAAAAGGIDPDVAFRRMYATALLRAGHTAAALDELREALAHEGDALGRAELLDHIATVHVGMGDAPQAIAAVERGLAELGVALPRRTPLLVAAGLGRLVAGLVVHLSRRWSGTATGERRRRYTTEAALLDTGAQAAGMATDAPLSAAFLSLGLLPVIRIGPSPQRARVLGALGMLALFAGASRLGHRVCTAGQLDAARSGDRALVAATAWMRGFGESTREWRADPVIAVMEEHGRWLELPDYTMAVSSLVIQLVGAGNIATAEIWVERARKRLRFSAAPLANLTVECLGAAVEAIRGRPSVATTLLRAALDAMPDPEAAERHPVVAWARLIVLAEQGEPGAAFDDVAARIEHMPAALASVGGAATRYAIAVGRVIQARAAASRPGLAGEERDRRRAQADRAVRALRFTRSTPSLRAGRLALRAAMLQLDGRQATALRLAQRALRRVDLADAPLQAFDILAVAARILRSSGEEAIAQRHATIALLLATEHGWEHRARAVRDAFAIHRHSGSTQARSGASGRRSGSDPGDVHQRRRLEALQQVTATAASVIEPEELISVALDISKRLLSAERVFVFLAQQDPRRDDTVLAPHRGRDADDTDLHELTNYSSTAVEQVWDTGEPVIVTGSDDGTALSSESAVVHGLRSILVAPLQLKGRMLGVIYLDSRVARGIFTTDDVEQLVGIAHQISAALETARAAQLDAEIQSTKRERDLAETLRTSMADLNATLDPEEVLQRLLRTVATILPGDRAVLLRHEADRLVVTAHAGISSAEKEVFDVASHPMLANLASRDTPMSGGTHVDAMELPPELSELLDTPRSWIAVPIALRDQRLGAIVVGAAEPDRYGDVEVNIAAVLGDQGAVAYDNAQLFSRVHQAATVDVLTGAATRHHFWELAEQHLAAAIRYDRPLAALMLDIDRFKPINDTYGHAVGDAVLRQVAARIRDTIRKSDILGRYGGEEFAMIVPEADDVVRLAERLRAAVSRTPISVEGHDIRVTISIGVSHLRPHDDIDRLLDQADAALYRSKDAGRDRVTVA